MKRLKEALAHSLVLNSFRNSFLVGWIFSAPDLAVAGPYDSYHATSYLVGRSAAARDRVIAALQALGGRVGAMVRGSWFLARVPAVVDALAYLLLLLAAAYALADYGFDRIGFLAGAWDELILLAFLGLWLIRAAAENLQVGAAMAQEQEGEGASVSGNIGDAAATASAGVGAGTQLLLPLLLFYAVVVVYFIAAPHRQQAFEELRVLLQPTLWFFVGATFIRSARQFRNLTGIFVALMLLVAAVGIYQYLVGAEMPGKWLDDAEVAVRTRAWSIMGSPNVFGSLMMFAAFVAGGHWLAEKNRLRKWVFLLAAGVFGAAMIVSFSRGAWLALLAAAVLLALWVDRRLIIAIVVVSLLAMVLVPGVQYRLAYMFSPDYLYSSLQAGRLDRWYTALEYWEADPILGLGLGRFGSGVAIKYFSEAAYSVDNYFVKIAAQMGLFGFFAFGYLVISALRRVRYNISRVARSSDRLLALGLLAGLMGVIFHAFVENLLDFPAMGVYFWFFLGTLFSLPRIMWPQAGDSQ